LSLMHMFPLPSSLTLVAPTIHPASSCSQGWGQVLSCCCCCCCCWWCCIAAVLFVVVVNVGSTHDPPCKQLLARLGAGARLLLLLLVPCHSHSLGWGRVLGRCHCFRLLCLLFSPSCPVTIIPICASNPPCKQRLTAVGGRCVLFQGCNIVIISLESNKLLVSLEKHDERNIKKTY
jgi:hypothetical protein